MKSGVFKRAIGLTFLYLGLFVVIVLVQFSRGPGLSVKIGGLSVNASYPKAARAGSAPEAVRLAYAGLVFEISPKSPAESVGADGVARRLALASVEKLPNGARVKLAPDVEILVVADRGQSRRVTVSASAPEGVAVLRLRFSTARDLRFASAKGVRSLVYAGGSYDLALGAGSFDPESGFLSLHPGDSGFTLAKVVPPAPPKPSRPGSGEAVAAQAPKDPEAFKAEIAAWRDKVWSGLSSSRFDADKLAWKGPDAASAFSERALTAYLAESLARGYYSDALVRVKGAKDRWPDKLGYLSAPYLGGLKSKMKSAEAADAAEVNRLTQLVTDKSPSILEKEGLLRFLVDRAPKELAGNALPYITAMDPAKLTIRQTVGYLGCAAESGLLSKDDANRFPNSLVAAEKLVAAVRKTSSGYFLVTEDDGSTDLRLSLLAGTALAAVGAASSKPNLVGAGQSLVEGVLGLADAQGFEPSRVVAASGELGQRSGAILPEDLYPIVADNPYYPHEVSFARDVEPGVWAWTCAPSLTAQTGSSSYTFLASFIAGRSHYLSFYGIKSFANIQLYDIDYSPDEEFESYDASGYLYHRDAKVLYLKMKHKKDVEDIKLFF
jgi:hypothetical protein